MLKRNMDIEKEYPSDVKLDSADQSFDLYDVSSLYNSADILPRLYRCEANARELNVKFE